MRKHWISFILCIMATGLAAQWSAPKIISDGYAPDFDIDPANGHLHVVSVLNGVIYTETDAEGNIVSGPQVIPGTTQDTEYWNFGATVAVDKNGYPHVCYRVYQGSNYLYNVYYTRKTGSGWLSNPLPLSSNRRRGYVVRMDIDSQNRVHVGIGWDDNDTDGQTIGPIAYYRIRNAIIEKAVDDINPAQIYYRVDNRFEMTVGSDDRVHFVAGCPGFPLTLEGPVTYFYSADNGNSFETVGNIHSPYCPTRNGNADIAVDNKGYVHMLYGAKIDNERNDQPSLRYVRYKNGKLIDKPITQPGDVKPWDWNPAVGPEHGKNYGLGSIACSEDGALVLAAFIDRPTFYSGSTLYMGNLYVMMSTDSGATWGAKQMLAEYVCNAEGGIQGRNLELIRSYKNHFYIIYPHSQNPKKVKMVYLRNVGDNPPVAHAGGPYSASEGGTITLNASGCTDSGQNPGIVKYEWDLNNDGIYDLTATQPTLQTSAVNDLYTSIKLRITDNAGHTSEATSSIQVLNVAPTVEAGKDTTINEGSTLGFHCTYTDPGVQDTHTIQWNFRDGTTSPDQSPFHTFNNDGQVTVTVKVTDNNNGIGRDSLKVTINNVPPVANAGGPYHAAINVPVNFTGFGSDVSPVDAQSLTYSWDLDNNSIYETQGQTASKTYTQEGIYIIGLKVMDNKDFQTDTARVIISNDPPVLSQIAGQNVMEGNTFSPVVLDNFVNDPDQDDADLMWSVSGQNQLLVSIADRILTVTIPDINWYGTETLTLRVQDAGGLTDSTHVTYAVTSVNDPPVWISPVPDFIIDEDSTVYISMDELWARAADVDHTDDQLIFTMHTESPVTWMIEPAQHRFWFKGEKDWNGTATFVYTVTDPAGMADRDTASLTIRPVPDNPAPFRIIEPILLDSTNASWPDSIMFRWHPSYDPDNPAGLIYYILSLKHIRALDSRNLTVFDTTLTFMTDKTMPDGQYLWYVTAYVPSGMSVQSNTGFIIVGEIEYQDVEAGRPVPEAYALNQNYPNPFNPETRITYHIPDRTRVDLSVFNALGQRIITLVSDDQSPGIYEIAWNGTDQFGLKVPTGIYICRMTAGSTVLYKKMMLIQ